MPTAKIVEQDNWNKPDLQSWVENVHQAVIMATRPVVFVGHSLGVTTIAHVAEHLTDSKVVGALLVAAPDLDQKKKVFRSKSKGLLRFRATRCHSLHLSLRLQTIRSVPSKLQQKWPALGDLRSMCQANLVM